MAGMDQNAAPVEGRHLKQELHAAFTEMFATVSYSRRTNARGQPRPREAALAPNASFSIQHADSSTLIAAC